MHTISCTKEENIFLHLTTLQVSEIMIKYDLYKHIAYQYQDIVCM